MPLQQPQPLHRPSHPPASTAASKDSHQHKLRDQNASLARHNTTLALRLRATREKLDRERASFVHAHSQNVHLMSRVRTLEQELQRANEAIERMQRTQFKSERQKGEMQRLATSTEQVFGSMITHLRAMADNLETNVLSAWSEVHAALDEVDSGETHADAQLYLPPSTPHHGAAGTRNHSRRTSIASTSSMASSPNPNDSIMSFGSEIEDLDMPESPSPTPPPRDLKRQTIEHETRFPRTLPEDRPRPLFPPESPAKQNQASTSDPWSFNTDPSQTHGQTNQAHFVREIEVPRGSSARPARPPSSTSHEHHFTQQDDESDRMHDIEMTDTIAPLAKPTGSARGGGGGRSRGGASSSSASSRRRPGKAWNTGSGFAGKGGMAAAGSRRSHPPSEREVRAQARAATKHER